MTFSEDNIYKLIAHRDTILVAREALKQYKSMMDGDFSFLKRIRKTRVTGLPVDTLVVDAAVNDLPILLYGPTKRSEGTYATEIRGALERLSTGLAKAGVSPDRGGQYYEITGTARDFRVLSTVCDSYTRVRLGQLGYAIEGLPQQWSGGLKWLHELRHLCESYNDATVGVSSGSSLGIGHKDASPKKEVACDLHQAIRYRLAWDRTPEGGMTVDFGTPMHYSGVPMPLLEAVPPGVAPSKRSKKLLSNTEGWF